MSDHVGTAFHADPIWRDRADFLIRALIADAGGAHIQFEELWVRQLGELLFELCCIPFHLSDVALGDTVRTDPSYELVEVVRRTEHTTYRVWLRDQPIDRGELVSALTDVGALLEWAGPDLLVIDAADRDMSQAIADYLWHEQQRERLIRETGDLVAR